MSGNIDGILDLLVGGCMNWEAIGAMGEVAGAIAVVATLVYLAR